MEKLKAKHDHKLTDILKVFIFGLFLIMPFLVFAPSLLYISFNPNAQAEQTTINVDEYKQIDFNQKLNIQDEHVTFTPIEYGENLGYYNLIDFDFVQVEGHKYIFKINLENISNNVTQIAINYNTIADTNNINSTSLNIEVYSNVPYSDYKFLRIYSNTAVVSIDYYNVQLFDLTQMFGVGNEPTLQQFNTYFPNDYYDYILSKPEVLKIGTTTETIQDVETQIANNWQQMWNKQIFKWTNETILYKGINAFSQTFGIFDNSYITNLITYELIIVMIYIVIDIILTMFKWLTHMIGEK